MQTDDLENRVSNHSSHLQYLHYPAQTSYRHFTLPVRQNGNCGKEVEKGGLLSKRPTSSPFQSLGNQVIPSSVPSPSHNAVDEKIHQNGHSHQQPMDEIITTPIALPVFKAPVQPRTNGHSNGQAHHVAPPPINLNHASTTATVPPMSWGWNQHASWLYDQETRRLSVVKVTTRHKTTFSDMLHFLGYTVGATTIVSLYLVVPLMILLNAILPSSWNRLLIALGILAVVEFLICIVLAKTTPRSKRKKENVLVQP
jgi:hypothetical protein